MRSTLAPRTSHDRGSLAGLASLVAAVATIAGAGAVTAACSSASSGGNESIYTDAGGIPIGVAPGGTISNDAGGSVAAWPPPGVTCSMPGECPGDPGPGVVYVTISGEANAISGYPFPPSDWANDTYFSDGWELVITEYIVVVDGITLWSNPDRNLTNQGDLDGMSVVAHLDGPFVVDLHKGGALTGQGGPPEQATPLGVIANQNDQGGAAFDSTTTYGVGFRTVPAAYAGYNVNLTPDEATDFDLMVQNGYSVFYRGHLTWKGDQSPYGCTSTRTAARPEDGGGDGGGSVEGGDGTDGGYDYGALPNGGIDLAMGFATPTDYVNCQNMALQGIPDPGEDYPRGIQISPSQSVVAQITVHMDHPFWESFAENSPVHFDQIAAQYVGRTNPTATIEDMRGVAFYAFTDATGAPMPWRNCAGTNYAPPGNGQMTFSTLSVPVDPNATCTGNPGEDYSQDVCPAIRDYADYMRFSQSTQGHLNSQGLCFVDRHYPAPAGGS